MEDKKNVSWVVKNNLCTGCGTCYAMCPKEAISIEINEKKGIYEPVIDETKCNNCGICMKVCPGHEVDFETLNEQVFGKQPEDPLIGNYINCYTGYSTNEEIRYNCSSGGLVTQLLIYALENKIIDGALVTRMKKDKPLEPEPFIARTKEEIYEARGSKYCPVPANIALKEILNAPEGEKFAVVGLPCHIHGIRKAEQINNKLKERIALHLGIFCSHTDDLHAFLFFLKRNKIPESSIVGLKYRSHGWPGKLQIDLITGKSYFDGTYLKFLHDNDFFTPHRCINCTDLTAELSDISLGDAWISEFLKKDKIGRSVCIIRCDASQEIVKKISRNKEMCVCELDAQKISKSQCTKLKKVYSLSNKKINQGTTLFKRNMITILKSIKKRISREIGDIQNKTLIDVYGKLLTLVTTRINKIKEN